MARRSKPQPASQESVDALADRMDRGFNELKAVVVRFAADVDRRFARTASLEMVADIKATVDRHTAVLDHIVGELTALESRHAPPPP